MGALKEKVKAMRVWQKWLCAAVVCVLIIGGVAGVIWGLSGSKAPQKPEEPDLPEDNIPIFIEPEEEEPEVVIQTYFVIGSWKNSRISGDGSENGEYGPFRSQDRDTFTRWNPEAYPGYTGDPGILYVFDKEYDLRRIVFTFSSGAHYFELHTSTDGETYTMLANIDRTNADKAFEKDVCTLDGLTAEKVKYVKVIFHGRKDGGNFVNFKEAEFFVTGAEPGDTAWMIAQKPDTATITSGKAVGNWLKNNVNHTVNGMANSYDNNPETKWNPQTQKGYTGAPGVIYTLDRAYNLKRAELTFASGPYYFDLYVSSDGATYTKLAAISALNVDKAYSREENYDICKLDGLHTSGVRYVKIVFTGKPGGGTWVNMQEVSLYEKGSSGLDTAWMLPDGEPGLPIVSAQVSGEWLKDSVDHATNGLANSYDGKLSTKWNPAAQGGYAGAPGVVYTLDKAYDVKRIALTFTYGRYYFDLYVSANGEEYTKLAAISEANADQAYSEDGDYTIATLDGMTASGVKYVKLIFTGRPNASNTWVNLQEVEVFDTGAEGLDTAWMLPAQEDEGIKITSAQVSGEWLKDNVDHATNGLANSYDGKLATKWNPAAQGGYAGAPGVVYTLDKAYDVKRIALTFTYGRYYFDLYVSGNGEEYTKLAAISETNGDQAYSEDGDYTIATLDGLTASGVKYVKLIFTGRPNASNTWVNLQEIKVIDTGTEGLDTAWMLPVVESRVEITSAQVSGEWLKDNVDHATNGLANSYDGKLATKWNPAAQGGYAGAPGVVYTLDRAYDVKRVALTFTYGRYYFDLYVSGNGEEYTKLAAISEANADQAYSEDGDYTIATLDGLTASGVKYVKLIFTGRPITNTWVNLQEVEVFDTGAEGLDTAWMLPVEETEEPETTAVSIVANQLTGEWILGRAGDKSIGPEKSYDGDASTKWNPQAKGGYAGQCGIIYTLDGYYQLSKATLTFGAADMYFELYGSADGVEYVKLGEVTAETAAELYEGATCTLAVDYSEAVQYVKVIFTGRANASDYVNFYEVTFEGIEKEGASQPEITAASILANQLTGEWVLGRAGDKSIGPEKSYDGDASTKWNPQAKGGYAGQCGIIYTLDGYYQLSKATLTFGAADMYFELYGSADGVEYVKLGEVTAETAAELYEGATCTLAVDYSEAVQYVKVIFTGRAIANDYVNLYESAFEGTKQEAAVPEKPEPVALSILANQITGEWVLGRAGDKSIGPEKSYDGDASTKWNPQAKGGYAGQCGIIYTLDGLCDLHQAELTFNAGDVYFEVYAGSDGTNYAKVGEVTSANVSSAYSGAVAKVDISSAKAVRYVKILFTGRVGGSTWINFYELKITGTAVQEIQ